MLQCVHQLVSECVLVYGGCLQLFSLKMMLRVNRHSEVSNLKEAALFVEMHHD